MLLAYGLTPAPSFDYTRWQLTNIVKKCLTSKTKSCHHGYLLNWWTYHMTYYRNLLCNYFAEKLLMYEAVKCWKTIMATGFPFLQVALATLGALKNDAIKIILFLITRIRYKFHDSSATRIYARWANNLDMVANTAENSMQMSW